MKTTLPLLLSLFAVSVLPRAGAQNVEDLQIKTRSVYAADPAARNPFWPIGWKKQEPVATDVVAPRPVPTVSDAFFRPERFVVTSISIGLLPLAMINGRSYGEGEFIRLDGGASVQIVSIRDGQVTLRFREKTIVVKIQEAAGSKPR